MAVQTTSEERLERDLRDLAYQQPAIAALSRAAQLSPERAGKPFQYDLFNHRRQFGALSFSGPSEPLSASSRNPSHCTRMNPA